MIAGGNAKSGDSDEAKKHHELKPIDPKIPEIDRQCGNGQNCRSDEE